MPELLTAARMRAIEQAAIASGEVTGLTLMERAGQGVVGAILAQWPEMASEQRQAVVLCGPGNNGGDGFVIARLLAAQGMDLRVFLYGNKTRLPPDARANHDLWAGAISPWQEDRVCQSLNPAGPSPQHPVIIDAMFGTGLTRPMPDDTRAVAAAVATLSADPQARIVAVDIPSGIDADTGAELGLAFRANLTVTFHGQKLGHAQGRGRVHAGHVVVVDIGL